LGEGWIASSGSSCNVICERVRDRDDGGGGTGIEFLEVDRDGIQLFVESSCELDYVAKL